MNQGYGPHGVISGGEIAVTLAVFALALVAFVWMAYRTRRTSVR
jgi:cbb3-type cytochrome oxidase subunit 3